MATQAPTRRTEQPQAIVDSAWRGPSGCGLRNDLFRGFIRQTPDYYGAAFADGMGPGDTFVDRPVSIPVDAHAVWRPTDAGPPTGVPMTLRDTLALSRNSRAMGVRDSPLDAVPSLALGTSPVTLKERRPHPGLFDWLKIFR